MAQIKVLSNSLINQIAAGEVIERPFSVVKELVENSIDARANDVVIEIVAGGLEAIIVTDNGGGISPEDARMAWERHATSKIESVEDLTKISSLGFRGEALASIASVAQCEMETKKIGDVSGWKLSIKDGVVESEVECGCPEGTRISVLNLFYNTPARLKYMKREAPESRHIIELVQEFAVANPNVAFKLVSDGKVVLDCHAGDIEDRIENVFGREVAMNLVPVGYEGAGLKIDGVIGKPIISKSNRKGQFIVLNGRVIQNHLIAHAVREAFHSMLMHGKHPWFLLNMTVVPEDVDVNVHPRKLEVRFLKQNEVYRAVYGCVEMALNKNELVPEASERLAVSSEQLELEVRSKKREEFVASEKEENQQEEEVCGLKAVAQIGNSYILAEDEEGLVIVDQHAAHERVMYEKLMAAMHEAKVVSQPVLVPQNVDFSAGEADFLRENVDVMREVGFEIEEFGGNSFLVTAVPADLSGNDAGEILRGLVDDFSNNRTTNSLSDRREHLIHYAACRSAVKFGKKLSVFEMQSLLDQLARIERRETCPHGRPTMIRMGYDELENRFKRRL